MFMAVELSIVTEVEAKRKSAFYCLQSTDELHMYDNCCNLIPKKFISVFKV